MNGAGLLLFTSALALPQEAADKPAFRANARVVLVDVYVGRRGRAVAGLTSGDFEIYDDGELQEVRSIAVADSPLDVMLVVDTSVSVTGATTEYLQEAASLFAENLASDDRTGVMTFSDHLRLVSPLGPRSESSLPDVRPGGGTCWRDALFASLAHLELSRRAAVVLFTDGADTCSWITRDQAMKLVKESNTVVYAVTRGRDEVEDLRSTGARSRYRRERERESIRLRFLEDITREGGGRLLKAQNATELRDHFVRIATELKTRYVLSYSLDGPTPREGWHEIRVKVKGRNLEVIARRGYQFSNRRRQ